MTPRATIATKYFTITFTPKSKGEKIASFIIENNDPDEFSYKFTVKGKGVDPYPVSYIFYKINGEEEEEEEEDNETIILNNER